MKFLYSETPASLLLVVPTRVRDFETASPWIAPSKARKDDYREISRLNFLKIITKIHSQFQPHAHNIYYIKQFKLQINMLYRLIYKKKSKLQSGGCTLHRFSK